MDIMVAPISGEMFPIQIAALTHLSHYGYSDPDLILASSGGVVSSFVAMASHWKRNQIYSVCSSLQSSLFVRNWNDDNDNFLPVPVLQYFKGAMYDKSYHTHDFFESNFTKSSIQKCEVWIGAINSISGAAGLFCTKSRRKSVITSKTTNSLIYREKLKYLNGSLNQICLASMASSCVPSLFEPVVIDRNSYIDGGTKYGSPLTPLYDELEEISGPIHITYLNGHNVDDTVHTVSKSSDSNMMDVWNTVSKHVIRGTISSDRLCARNIIQHSCSGTMHYQCYDISKLSHVLNARQHAKASLVEIYPTRPNPINLTKFTGDDLIRKVKDNSNHLGIRVWWKGHPNLI